MKIELWTDGELCIEVSVLTRDDEYDVTFESDPPDGQSAVDKALEFIRPVLADEKALEVHPWRRTIEGRLYLPTGGDE